MSCKLCHKRVLGHALSLQCSVCGYFSHIRCLSNVCKDDTLYTNRASNKWICTICSGNIFPFNHFDDDEEFNYIIHDNILLKNCPMSLEKLNSMEHSFFETSDISDINNGLTDADPDIQHFSALNTYKHGKSKYNNEGTFSSKCSELSIDANTFSLTHINIRSLPANLNNFENYLEGLSFKFSVLGFSET